jgi:tetratricopeptide (TPR) repeat protein
LLLLAQAGQIAPNDPELAALMLDPGDDALEIYEALVRGYLETFHVGPALMLLDAWQADYPDDPQSYFYRGLIWTHQKEWPDAAAAFRNVLRLAPARYDARLHLARVLREDYRYREALWHYRRCVEEQEDPEALLGWGLCLQALGESEEAREVFLRLLAQVPDHYEGRLAIGKLDFSYGRAEEAVQWLEPAAKQRPYDVDVRHTLAWALLSAGEKERAREHFRFAVKAQEAAMRVENLMARVDQSPNNVELRYEIGATLMQYGQLPAALAWFHSALQLAPHHRPTHQALAECYSRQGNHEAAAEHRRMAESLE